jgi:ATP-dependent Lhr-like helicase
MTPGVAGAGHALTRAARDVLLGADPPVELTPRARRVLAEVREQYLPTVHPAGTVITRNHDDVRWWTWAGYKANATLAATLSHLTDSAQRFDDTSLRMRADLTLDLWRTATADATVRLCLPDIDHRALAGLKFNEALPERLATATLAARLADLDNAAAVLREPVRFLTQAPAG